jgi:hypothetical protein
MGTIEVAANGKVIKKTKQPARSRLIPGAQVLNITQRDPLLGTLEALLATSLQHPILPHLYQLHLSWAPAPPTRKPIAS